MVIITIYQLNKNNVVTQSIESSQRIGYERVTDNVVMQSIESSQRIEYDRAPKEEEEGESRCNFQSVHLCDRLRNDSVNSTNAAALPKCIDKVSVSTKSSRRREGNETFINRHHFPQCKFTPIDEGGPVPVIFIINGRSGSEATWSTLSTLAGSESAIGEHTGENKVKAMDFLGGVTEEAGAWWVTKHLCQFAHAQCDKPLSAFKWKPFVDSFQLPAAQGMLKKIATFNQPRIKVIFMTRNPLDVLISKAKHKKAKKGKIGDHCAIDDEECVERMKKAGSGLQLPTQSLLNDLKDSLDAFKFFEDTFEEMNIAHVKTTYEDLYNRDDADEWMKIFRYLGRGPTKNLTMQDVSGSFALAPTFQRNHNESLANYVEVRDLLMGTDFEKLLH